MNQGTKAAVAVSVLLNAILVALVVGFLPFLLFLSACLNLLAFFYVRDLLRELAVSEENIIEISSSLSMFANHIEKIYEMETFYGDTVLQELLEHSQYVVEDIDKYISIQTESEQEIEEINFDSQETS
tara:strand:- start:13422 stop:13805 length:384 start_codon:yes stop_codon:yes gene_type:complete